MGYGSGRSRNITILFMAPLFLVLFCIVPSHAATINIVVSGDVPDMTLTPGITNQNSSIRLDVTTSETSSWTVSVRDAMDDSKPEGTEGRMAEWGGSSYVSGGKYIGAQMNVQGSSGSGYSGSSVDLTDSDQAIETGNVNDEFSDIMITLFQPVSYSDPHLTGGNVYRIVLIFTGAAT